MAMALNYSDTATLVLRTIPDPVGSEITLRTELANRQAGRLLALPFISGFAQPIDTALPGWLSAALQAPSIQAIGTNQPIAFELAHPNTATGDAGGLAVCIQPVGDGQRLVVSLTDRTALRQPILADQPDARFFQTLAAALPNLGVVVMDPVGTIRRVAGLMPGLLTHRQPQDLLGQQLREEIMADYRPDWERYLTAALAGESYYFSDHWNAWRCECYVGPLLDPVGGVGSVLIVFRNVTEAYRQQQALLTLNQALTESNERLERLAYVASHDLQEPLRKIQLLSDLIRKGADERLNAQEQDRLNRMHEAAQRLSELVESLLSLAQLGGPALPRTLVNLGDLLSTLVSDLAVSIQERGAIIELIPPLPTIVGDEAQLRQLFQNLLSNALKFTAPGVPPRIGLQARLIEPSAVAEMGLLGGGPYVEVSVTDNGIGMAAQHLEDIFGLFTRLHGRHQYAGAGLGLASVKQVVDNHQGSIRVESQEGTGTVVRVYLPVT